MSDPAPPSRHTFAAYRQKTDAELEDILAGGPIGNRDVDSARAELDRRSSERQERWARRAYRAAVVAAIIAAVGAAAAIAALF